MSLSGSALLFDLDGTLVDTAPDLAGTMNDLMAKLGYPPIPIDTIRVLVGRGARALIEHGLAFHGHTASAVDLDQMFAAFIDIYATRIARESRAYPTVEPVLDRLIAMGAKLAVVTNKPEGLAKLLLDALDLTTRFKTVIGFETATQPKPHADPILLACARLGVPVNRALMVGDSATDVAAARAAGIPVVVVRDGYTEIPADELGGDIVIDNYDALVEAVEKLLAE